MRARASGVGRARAPARARRLRTSGTYLSDRAARSAAASPTPIPRPSSRVALLALDATSRALAARRARAIPAAEFLAGPVHDARSSRDEAIVAGQRVPPPPAPGARPSPSSPSGRATSRSPPSARGRRFRRRSARRDVRIALGAVDATADSRPPGRGAAGGSRAARTRRSPPPRAAASRSATRASTRRRARPTVARSSRGSSATRSSACRARAAA